MKALSCPQHFFQCSRICNSEVNGRTWPEFELVREFMAVLGTCNRVPQHFLHYKSMGKIFGTQGQVTPKRIVRSSMKSNASETFLVTCKFAEDPIKTESTIVSITFLTGNSKVNGHMRLELELFRDFTVVLFTCKFDDDPIKNEGANFVHNIFSIISLWGKF